MIPRILGNRSPDFASIGEARMFTTVDFSGPWAAVCARYGLDPDRGYAYSLDGATGAGEPSDLWYAGELSGPDGMHYTLFREPQHTPEDVARAKEYCRRRFDVTGFSVVRVEWKPEAETIGGAA